MRDLMLIGVYALSAGAVVGVVGEIALAPAGSGPSAREREVRHVDAHRRHRHPVAGRAAQLGQAVAEREAAAGAQLDAVVAGPVRELELLLQRLAGQQLLLAGNLDHENFNTTWSASYGRL